MIEFQRNPKEADASRDVQVRVLGVGGAGSNIVHRIAREGGESSNLVGLHTDARALNMLAVPSKIQLGKDMMKGLGCGGDPEMGRAAAMEATSQIRDAVSGAGMVFVVAGLGGGTGSGAAPVVARIAKEAGCFVVVFVTLPFHFEGKRRVQQANLALNELRETASALLIFENDRMGELVRPEDGVQQAFEEADKMICQSVRAITSLIEKPGMIRIGMDDLLAVLKGKNSRCLFGFGAANGADRAKKALDGALNNPMLDKEELQKSTSSILVHLSGSDSVKLTEVQMVMETLGDHVSDSAHLLFGVSTNEDLGDQFCVTIISSVERQKATAQQPQNPPPAVQPTREPEPEPTRREPEPRREPVRPANPSPAAVQPTPAQPKPAEPAQAQPAPAFQPTQAVTQKPASVPGKGKLRPVYPLPSNQSPTAAVQPQQAPPKPAPEVNTPSAAPAQPQPAPAPAQANTEAESDSIFRVVKGEQEEATEQVPTKAPAHFTPGNAKVKIEFSEDEEAPSPGKQSVGDQQTITLQPPEPSFSTKQSFPSTPNAPVQQPEERGKLQPQIGSGNGAKERSQGHQAAPKPAPAPAPAPVPANGNGNGTPEPTQQPSGPIAAPRRQPGGEASQAEVSRGRFENAEPTVEDGQDLDVPTFLRKKKRAQ